MFWRLELATVWRLNQAAKNACLAETGAVFLNLFQFSLEHLWLFIFSLNYLLPKHSVLPFPFSIVAYFLLEFFKSQVWVFNFELIFTWFLCFSLRSFAYVLDLEMGLCFGYCSLFMLSLRMLLLKFVLILVVSFLVFTLCLAKCVFYFIWSRAVVLFQNVPLDVVSFTVLNVLVLLC